MQRRIKMQRRMLAVQVLLENLDAAKLARIQQTIDSLKTEETELIERLNGEAMPERLFARSALMRLQLGTVEGADLAKQKQVATQALLARSRKVRLCETMLKGAQAKARAHEECTELAELLEVFAMRKGYASL